MLHFASYFLAQPLMCGVHVFGGKNALFVPFEPGDRWHVSVLPTLVLARSANDAGASTAAQSGRTKGTALFLPVLPTLLRS